MLNLSRKIGEVICIGDDITIMVCRIDDDKVRLGISAPCDIPVHRQEVYDAIQRAAAEKDPFLPADLADDQEKL